MRSDYAGFVDGESWAERTWALRALARLGKFDPAYGNELARRAQFLDLENVANVVTAFDRAGLRRRARAAAARPTSSGTASSCGSAQGKRDLRRPDRDARRVRQRVCCPPETRTIAEMTRALAAPAGGARAGEEAAMLSDALVGLGRGDGWGTTNANAAAIAALAERLAAGDAGGAATG